MNEKGWLKIVEAFIAVLLIASVLLIVINQGYIGGNKISEKVYSFERSILREIELDESLREEILNPATPPPISWESDFPPNTKLKIEARTPTYLNCEAKICKMNEVCFLDNSPEGEDVYVQSIAITATSEVYLPRQLVLFCWSK